MRDGAGGEEKKDTSEDMGTMYDCRKCMYNGMRVCITRSLRLGQV